MPAEITDHTSEKEQYPADLSRALQIIFRVSTFIVLFIGLMDITGWITGIAWLKSLGQYWIAMKPVSALCFVLTSGSLAILFTRQPVIIGNMVPVITGIFLVVISSMTVFCWFHLKVAGNESSLTGIPVLSLFLSTSARIPLLSSFLFLFTGITLLLLTLEKPVASDIAHFLFFPVTIASYIVPISYLLNAFTIHELIKTPMALNSGIAFCAVCVSVYVARPETWLMKVYTSRNTGGIMARRLLPWLILLPVVIGLIRNYGEQSGLFISEVGVMLVAVIYTFGLVLLVWFTAKSVNLIDNKRFIADQALKKSYDELENRVRERTAELLKLNKVLDEEITERKKAEALVESEHQRINGILELMPAYIILLTPDYQVSYSNRFFRERFGKSQGRRCYEFLFNRSEPCEICETYKVLKDNKTITWEWTGPDGHNYSIYDFPYADSDGSQLIMEVGIDITSLKKAEANLVTLNAELEKRVTERTNELSDTKNYLENLIDNANAPIIVWDQQNKIRLFNHAFERLTGYTSSEVAGKKLDLLFPIDTLEESLTKIKNAQTENWETIEIPILTEKKKIRTVLWNSAKIFDKNRKTFSTIAQGNDITERIEAERAFKASKEKLDIALENGKIGTWEWEISTGKFNWDERMERMFGQKPGTFRNTYEAFEEYIHEEDLLHVRNAFRQALKENSPLDTIYRIRHNTNDINYISTKALVKKDNEGNPKKMSGVCFDITEMKIGAEKVLFHLNEELLRSNRELEQFAYVASHDLQEPLRMVSSFTQLLAQRYKDKLDSDAQGFIQFAVEGAARMQVMINDLLDYSRIGTRGKEFSKVDIHDVLGRVVSNLQLRIQEKNALITNDEVPTVVADEGQMIQLFQNLILNALKFCKTSPRIHISAKEEKEHYLFSVKDNGIGIEAQYFEKIFQIFQRLHLKDQYGGTGIGLPICKRIIDRHGGKIWVESRPGKGSVFYFTILKNNKS